MALHTAYGVRRLFLFPVKAMRSNAKQHAAEQVLGGGVREGLYVFVQMPGEPLEIKVYAPWRSYPPGKRERRREDRLRRKLNAIPLD